MKKVILISIDGMRPDAFLQCGNPFAREMMRLGSYTLKGRTVFPSITLPCHLSLFHSVPPERHGTRDNTFVPMVRPVPGLFEQLCRAEKKNAMFYGWEPLRDVTRPLSLTYAEYLNAYDEEHADASLTDSALARLEKSTPDFVFLYMVETDEKGGHDNGWMSEEYLARISAALDNVKRVYERWKNEYTIIVTADHGGHDRIHGTDLPEDMAIPMFFIGPEFKQGKELDGVRILDIAPTVAKLMDVPAAREWEGRPVF